MKTVIRKLNSEDVVAYKELRALAFSESSSAFSESHEDEKDHGHEFFNQFIGHEEEHFTIGCFVNDVLAGFATFKRDKRSKARHKSFIHTMYVAPEYRGRGLAQKILLEVLARAKTFSGLEQIHLWVLNPHDSVAKKLYQKAGFVTQGAVVKKDLIIDGNYVDAEYMTMELK